MALPLYNGADGILGMSKQGEPVSVMSRIQPCHFAAWCDTDTDGGVKNGNLSHRSVQIVLPTHGRHSIDHIAGRLGGGMLPDSACLHRLIEWQQSDAVARKTLLQPSAQDKCDAVLLNLRVTVMHYVHFGGVGLQQSTISPVQIGGIAHSCGGAVGLRKADTLRAIREE